MTPTDIKVALVRAKISQRAIARKAGLSVQAVNQVIHGRITSDRAQRAVAEAIRRPVYQVFPDRYVGGAARPPGRPRKQFNL